MDNHSRYSYSGPLVAGVGQLKAGKKFDESSVNINSRTDLSKFSGLVACRTNNQSSRDDQRDKSKSSQYKVNNHSGRFSGPFSEWELEVKQDQNRHSQRISVACQEEGITQSLDSMHDSKIAFSGPLVSSHKVDQMLKNHDRQVQEYARRTQQERMKHMKLISK